MIDTPGAVIDPYDDDFESLKDLMGGREAPDFIKTAAVMSREELQRLPDHAFAMVVVGDDYHMRKFACTDAAHTAVNVMYFLENLDEYPQEAKEKVATNLLSACHHFDLAPPAPLVKEAAGRKVLIKTEGRQVTVPRREKEANLSGGPVMPFSARPNLAKLGSRQVISDPYVRPGRPAVRAAEPENYDPSSIALDDMPLVSFDQVKEAMAFFHSFGDEFHPRQRHEMCVKIASRANELGIPVDEVIEKYGSRTFETQVFLKAAAERRRQVWADLNDDGTAPGLLDMLMEKQASGDMPPEVFAEALSELDVMTGTDRFWDGHVPDPWFTTFGVDHISKSAEEKAEEWRWSKGTEYLTKDQLTNFAKSETGKSTIKKKFSDSMAQGLAGNPTTVFDSLPMDTQRAIARMAQQHESGL